MAISAHTAVLKGSTTRLGDCTRGAVWLSVKRSWRDGPCHLCHRGALRKEPLVEPFRTAVRAEMAKSGHALHPAICRSDEPELVVVVVACAGHREAFCKNEHSCPR